MCFYKVITLPYPRAQRLECVVKPHAHALDRHALLVELFIAVHLLHELLVHVHLVPVLLEQPRLLLLRALEGLLALCLGPAAVDTEAHVEARGRELLGVEAVVELDLRGEVKHLVVLLSSGLEALSELLHRKLPRLLALQHAAQLGPLLNEAHEPHLVAHPVVEEVQDEGPHRLELEVLVDIL